MFRGRRGRGSGGGVSLPILLLGMQMMQAGFDRIPPVTLLGILAQVAIFLKPRDFPLPSVRDVCISPVNVWYYEDYSRLLLAAFFHGSDWHLYYNMVSYLWKGMRLERRLGSLYFLYMIIVFALASNACAVGLDMLAEKAFEDSSYLYNCAVGFSGVLFALKVVTTSMTPPGMQYIMGLFPVPSRYACWVELVVIHLIVPNASFSGHLAGILVGLLYVKGPLKYIMNIPVSLLFGEGGRSGPSYTYTHGATGNRVGGSGRENQYNQRNYPEQNGAPSQGWFGSGRTNNYPSGEGGASGGRPADQPDFSSHEYTGGFSEEEQIAEAIRQSQRQSMPSPHGPAPSAPTYRSTPSVPTYTSTPSAPTLDEVSPPRTNPHGIYPDLTNIDEQNQQNEEVRRRRLQISTLKVK